MDCDSVSQLSALLCSVDNQSVDRAYRIGQQDDVVVRILTSDCEIWNVEWCLSSHQ